MKPTTLCTSAVVATAATLGMTPAVVAAAAATPDLTSAVGYLTTTTNDVAGGTTLGTNGYYEQATDTADFGLTVEAADALAAANTPTANAALAYAVNFVANGTDGAGKTVTTWTGATAPGAAGVQSGNVAQEALLAEIVGDQPTSFGGQDLIDFLDHAVCSSTSTTAPTCAAAGNYDNATTTIAQAYGVIAQLRGGDSAGAGSPMTYLESLQNHAAGSADIGSWTSSIPAGGAADTASTAVSVMALSLAPTNLAAAEGVTDGLQWLGSDRNVAATDDVSSAALTIMALSLDRATYSKQIADAEQFLASQQDSSNGSFGSVAASAEATSATVGTPLSALSDAPRVPSITVTAPATGASYVAGSAPAFGFTCTIGGPSVLRSGLTGCSASVDGGAAVASGSEPSQAVGSHTVVVNAAETNGLTASTTVTYRVTDPATTGGAGSGTSGGSASSGGGTHSGARKKTKRHLRTAGLQISRTRLSSRRWRIVVHHNRWSAGTITYRLSEPARVTLTFTRRAGRRWVSAGILVHNSHQGFNRVRVAGGAGVRQPAPGRYRVVIKAARSHGVSVRAKALTFTIGAPRQR